MNWKRIEAIAGALLDRQYSWQSVALRTDVMPEAVEAEEADMLFLIDQLREVREKLVYLNLDVLDLKSLITYVNLIKGEQ